MKKTVTKYAVYPTSTALCPSLPLSKPPDQRKRHGIYYTPPELVRGLLDAALDPLIEETIDRHGNNPIAVERALLSLSLYDPACGSGNFLLAAAQRLADALLRLRGDGSRRSVWEALRQVVAHCVFGQDRDPRAVEECRRSLWALCGDATSTGHELDRHVRCGDSLLDDASENHFDLVVGNPPFVNAIEGYVPVEEKLRLRRRFPHVGGTADLATYFLARALELRAPNGRIAFILPRSILCAPAAQAIRSGLPPGLRPNLIDLPQSATLFAPARVYVCLLVLGPQPECLVRNGSDSQCPARIADIQGSNWWRSIESPRSDAEDHWTDFSSEPTNEFDATASMTAEEAYLVRGAVVDSPHASGPKLITTGLIDPGGCSWGHRPCRYLGRRYSFPRIEAERASAASLRRRLSLANRPKLLVAGLSRRLECFVDEIGECAGAVSTYSIVHRNDNVRALRELCAYVLSPAATSRFRAELGATAMGGGNITVTKRFLRGLLASYQRGVQPASPAGSVTNETDIS